MSPIPTDLRSAASANRIYTDDLVEIEAFEVHHGKWNADLHGPFPAMGYRITTPDRIVVISGDTGPFPGMASTYADCDVLVYEVYASAGLAARAPEWRTYHARSHTSGTHLGGVATEADPGVLVLNHQLLWHATEDEVIGEVAAAYGGPLCTVAISTSSDTDHPHPPAITRSERARSVCSPMPRQGRR